MAGHRWERAVVLTITVGALAVDLAGSAASLDDRREPDVAATERPPTSTSTTIEVASPATPAPTRAGGDGSVIPPSPPPTPPAATAPAPPPPAPTPTRPVVTWTLRPHQGVGVWLDVYDWTYELTGGMPTVHPADVDRMADLGIQTLYIQTAHNRSAADVIEPDRLLSFIDRAHARGMAVVAWYLPMLEDVDTDLSRLVAASRLPVDGLGVDIESRAVPDAAERTRRLLDLTARLRQAVGRRAIAAITPSAVHLQVINPGFWPGFPWPELAAAYDVILPMSYWSIRRPEWRSGERYIGENIDRIRTSTGQPDVPIHVIGGIADGASLADIQGMVRAIQARGILGGSLYDWNTSQPAQWDALRPLRVG